MAVIARDNIILELEARTQKFNSELDASGRKVQGFGSLAKSVAATAATVFATIGFGQIISESVKAAAAYETLNVSLETFLGSATKAKKVVEDLAAFAAKTPFQLDEVNNAGRALLAFGVEASDLIPVLTRVGDIAAGTGKNFNELAVIYGKARVAGTLYAEDINQLAEAGIDIYTLFADQLGITTTQVKKFASEGKISFKELETAFKTLTSEGGDFFNLTLKQSQTLAGRLSTLKDNAQALLRDFGLAIAPLVSQFVDFLSKMIQGARNLGPALLELLPIIKSLTAALVTFFVSFKIASVITGIRAMITGFGGLSVAIGSARIAVVAFGTALLRLIQTNAVVLALSALAGAVVYLNEKIKSSSTLLKEQIALTNELALVNEGASRSVQNLVREGANYDSMTKAQQNSLKERIRLEKESIQNKIDEIEALKTGRDQIRFQVTDLSSNNEAQRKYNEEQRRTAAQTPEVAAEIQKLRDQMEALDDILIRTTTSVTNLVDPKLAEKGRQFIKDLQDQLALTVSQDTDRTSLLIARRKLIESVVGSPEQIKKQLGIIDVIFDVELEKLNRKNAERLNKIGGIDGSAVDSLGRNTYSLLERVILGDPKLAQNPEILAQRLEKAFDSVFGAINLNADRLAEDQALKDGSLFMTLFGFTPDGLSGSELRALEDASLQVLSFAKDLTGKLIDEEIRRKDLQIDIARQRVDEFRALAEKGGAEQLQLEEQRLEKLNQEREKAAQRGRQIAALEIITSNAVAIANAIEGVIKGFAKTGNPILGVANAAILAATVGSIILAVRGSQNAIPAFKDGTPYVEGPGTGKSDSILARLSKGERVTDAETNAPWKNVSNKELFKLATIGLNTVNGGSSVKVEQKLDDLTKAVKQMQVFMHVDQIGLAAGIDNVKRKQTKLKKSVG